MTHYYDNFETAAATAPSKGFTVYWLGNQFEVSGTVFSGPYVADWGDEFPEGGLAISYAASLSDHPITLLDILLYSPAAWSTFDPTVVAYTPRETTAEDVVVRGKPAQLRITRWPSGVHKGEIRLLSLIQTLGDTTVVVNAPAYTSPTPGAASGNPLIDEQTFLNVLENLRPYPP